MHSIGYYIHRVNDRFHTIGKPTRRYKIVDRIAGWVYFKG